MGLQENRPDFHENGPDTQELDVGSSALRNALQDVLATTLVSSTSDAEEVVPSAVKHENTISLLPVFSAALGSIAVAPLANALAAWLSKRGQYLVHSSPRWFKPAISVDSRPILATLTEFSNQRSKYIRQAVDNGVPVMLSRHGKVVAAVVPLQEGVFEEETYARAAREIREERLRGKNKTAEVLRNLTDEEIDLIRSAEDKVQAAAALGIDISDEDIPDEWHNPKT